MTTKKQTLQERIAKRLAKSSRNVFLTSDFKTLSDEDQVIRALRNLITKRKLLRLGKGVYAKARPSVLNGRPVLADTAGFQVVAQEALSRLGVKWEPTEAQKAYAADRSTQVPVNPVVKITTGRFSRKLSYAGKELALER